MRFRNAYIEIAVFELAASGTIVKRGPGALGGFAIRAVEDPHRGEAATWLVAPATIRGAHGGQVTTGNAQLGDRRCGAGCILGAFRGDVQGAQLFQGRERVLVTLAVGCPFDFQSPLQQRFRFAKAPCLDMQRHQRLKGGNKIRIIGRQARPAIGQALTCEQSAPAGPCEGACHGPPAAQAVTITRWRTFRNSRASRMCNTNCPSACSIA